jgi:hypothetical protein
MWRAGSGRGKPKFVCRVKEAARNEERIRVNDCTFVGRAHQFGATKQQVKDFINNLRRNADGTHV